MHPMRRPVAVERTARSGPVNGSESADWRAMVEGVQASSLQSAREFKERYRQGVLVFLRRHVGAVGLTQLVEDSLDGALREIGAGRLVSPADLVHFLRNVLEQELLVRNLEPARSLVALSMATDHGRLNQEAGFIQEALTGFSEPEQRALRGYYDGALTAEQAGAMAGVRESGFPALREKLYEAVRAVGLRKMPKSETAAPKVRAMAANSGGLS